MTTQQYISNISKRYQSGIAGEHSYRADLESLIRHIVPEVEITNEPLKVTKAGNPDYVITRKKIPIGFIEAKDIGKDLKNKTYNEQFDRYRKALDNLIITDYMSFMFYEHGTLVHTIKIAEIEDTKINAISDSFEKFENLIKNFCSFIGQTIKSSKKLASMMAAKARLLQNILENAVTSDEETQDNTLLQQQYETFKTILIHDLKPKQFADIYAQTLAYGMFAARLHDKTLENFSRQEAAELIPKSNPFLRKLFQYVAGYDIDERIVTTVDNLADVFRATNVDELLHNFGKSTQMHDPIIHFYEDFLAAYDPKLRKSRGVWYTPAPVVNFIVRAVDDILKTDFNLPQGLADTTKTKIKIKEQGNNKETEKEVHRVQILDPATGTGTFLAEVVKYIYSKKFKAMQGAWSGYVDDHLIPRLNGFELLMASYSMAHLKLDMLLTETGYKKTKNQRFNIYLTNSLEEHHPNTGTLFSNWLSTEANEANKIKRDTPVMCVIGNPPYAVSSSNKGEWIQNLIKDYKKDLNEKNIQPLSDDYIKFIRFGEHLINKNGSGVLAYISNNSFIDGIIHRQMRKHLSESFDNIYILDLHGNAKKKEVCPDGSPDKNVFDIMQGVSINIFVKKIKSKTPAKILHHELFGTRQFKYNFLSNNNLKSINWKKLKAQTIYHFFVDKIFLGIKKYETGFKLENLFNINTSGIKTHDDSSLVSLTPYAENNLPYYYRPFDIRNINYDLKKVQRHRFSVMQNLLKENFALLTSRQQSTFDFQHILISKHLVDMCAVSLQTKETTYAFPLYIYNSQAKKQNLFEGIESEKIRLQYKLEQAKEHYAKVEKFFNQTVKPFYNKLENPDDVNTSLYEENRSLFEEAKSAVESLQNQIELKQNSKQQPEEQIKLKLNSEHEQAEEQLKRIPNLDMKIVEQIAEKLDIEFVAEKDKTRTDFLTLTGFETLSELKNLSEVKTFAPIDILDYIYAVLHSPTYREKYKEFLKIDFPRVPYPKDPKTFWQLVKLGGEIRQIHLLESPKVEEYITGYPIDTDNAEIKNRVTRKIAKKDWEITNTEKQLGRIWINDEQYFENTPLVAWEFYIGGYQPAQKWLKDRSPKKGKEGRILSFEDILHYQKIIVALTQTDRLMKEIDKIEIE